MSAFFLFSVDELQSLIPSWKFQPAEPSSTAAAVATSFPSAGIAVESGMLLFFHCMERRETEADPVGEGQQLHRA